MTITDHIMRLPVVGTVARKLYWKFKGTFQFSPSYLIPLILSEPRGVAVQIGSNDGKNGDPLHYWLKESKGWTAVFVEPVPFLFERLKNNYSGEERFSFENVVINDGTSVDFFWVSEEAKIAMPETPSWYDQLGGFTREHITKHLAALDPFIKCTRLSGITLTTLFDRHHLENVDLLHIDTEGADFLILKQLDLERFRPRVILYERKHLSQEEIDSSIRFLQDHYALFALKGDILAIKKETYKTKRRSLKPLRSHSLPEL